MERVAFRPVRGANPATLLVTSFAVSFLLQSLAMLIFGDAAEVAPTSRQLFRKSFEIGELRSAELNVITSSSPAILLGGLALS